MYVIYYRSNENAYLSVKDSKVGLLIGGTTKKYLLCNTKQYNTFVGASRVAKKLIEKVSNNILEIKVVQFKDFEKYIDNLTCKCGCNITLLPVGGGCYNIPEVGIILPKCYETIVPTNHQGSVLAIKDIQNYIELRKEQVGFLKKSL